MGADHVSSSSIIALAHTFEPAGLAEFAEQMVSSSVESRIAGPPDATFTAASTRRVDLLPIDIGDAPKASFGQRPHGAFRTAGLNSRAWATASPLHAHP